MRHLLTSVIFVVFLFPSLALGQGVTMDDLVERDGLYYKEFTDVPFTGEVTGQHQGRIKDGKQDGPWVGYHENGQLNYKGTYKDGEQDGPWVVYHDNGRLSYKGAWKNEAQDGPWVGYWEGGELWLKGTYKDGKKEGVWVGYFSDGTVWEKYTGTFKDGVKVE